MKDERQLGRQNDNDGERVTGLKPRAIEPAYLFNPPFVGAGRPLKRNTTQKEQPRPCPVKLSFVCIIRPTAGRVCPRYSVNPRCGRPTPTKDFFNHLPLRKGRQEPSFRWKTGQKLGFVGGIYQ